MITLISSTNNLQTHFIISSRTKANRNNKKYRRKDKLFIKNSYKAKTDKMNKMDIMDKLSLINSKILKLSKKMFPKSLNKYKMIK